MGNNFSKKFGSIFLVLFLILFLMGAAFAAYTVTSITSPVAGADWNGTHNITWTGSGDGNVNILCTVSNFLGGTQSIASDVNGQLQTKSWDTNSGACKTTYGDSNNYQIQVIATVGGSSSASGIFTVDNTKPTATTVTMDSNNANSSSLAKLGNLVTLHIVTSEDINTPTITIDGNVATVSDLSDGNARTWSATKVMIPANADGNVTFTLDFNDYAGNVGTRVTAVTSGLPVLFDKTAPTASVVKDYTNNSVSSLAKVGDIVTLDFNTSEIVTTPLVTIDSNAASVSSLDSNAQKWRVTLTLAQYNTGDANIPFTIDFNDLSGNAATEVTAITVEPNVYFDKTVPVILRVFVAPGTYKIGSNIDLNILSDVNAHGTYAGNSIVVNGQTLSNTLTNYGDGNYKVTYTVGDGNTDRNSVGAIPIVVSIKDGAGNVSNTYITSPVSPGSVTIDAHKPTATTVSMDSNNSLISTRAKAGDSVTLHIVTSEAVNSMYVTIDSNAATVTGSGTSWTATKVMGAGNPEGNVTFTLDFNDLAFNNATQVTSVTSGNPVVYDITVPTASVVKMYSNNSVSWLAKVGDTITVDFNTSELVGTPVVTIDSNAASVSSLDSNAQKWRATLTLAPFNAGDANVSFTVDFNDLVGNAATQVTAVTTGVKPYFDKTLPVISALYLTTNGVKKIDNSISLRIVADSNLYTAGTITVNGVAVTGFTNVGDGNYTATYTVGENNNDDANGTVPASAVLVDAAGNVNTAFTTVQSNFIVVDAHRPTVVSATSTPSVATPGDVNITVVFSEDMNTSTDVNVLIEGLTDSNYRATKLSYSGSTWIGHFTLDNNNEVKTAIIYVDNAQDSNGNTMTSNNSAGTFSVRSSYQFEFPKSGTGFRVFPRSSDLIAKLDLNGMSIWSSSLKLSTFLASDAGPASEKLAASDVNNVYIYSTENGWVTVPATGTDTNFSSYNMYSSLGSLNYFVFELKNTAMGKSIRHQYQ